MTPLLRDPPSETHVQSPEGQTRPQVDSVPVTRELPRRPEPYPSLPHPLLGLGPRGEPRGSPTKPRTVPVSSNHGSTHEEVLLFRDLSRPERDFRSLGVSLFDGGYPQCSFTRGSFLYQWDFLHPATEGPTWCSERAHCVPEWTRRDRLLSVNI